MDSFQQKLEIIDGNPFVPVPKRILENIFLDAHRNRSPILVHGTINGQSYRQTLVKYKGDWRLYINMTMLLDSPRRIGEWLMVEVAFDPRDRSIDAHPLLVEALNQNQQAKKVFDGLAPSKQKEIIRYIDQLKTYESVKRNVIRAIRFLLGEGSFVGRDSP